MVIVGSYGNRSLSESDFVQELVRRMQSHPLWQHPFFQLVRTRPTLAILQQWAIQAGRIDQAFAEILTNMLVNPIIVPSMHGLIAENLNDELGNGDPRQEHFTLFQDVLQAIGVSVEEYETTPMTQGTERIIRSLLEASRGRNPLQILGMMASEELICPNEFPLFLEAMSRYGTPYQLRYFDEHIQADVRHSFDLIRLCYQAAEGNPEHLEEVFRWQAIDLDNNLAFYNDLMELVVKS